MYKSKRIISLILCFILVLGMMPSTPVLAASPNITTEAASNIGYYKATVSAYVATNGGNYFEEHGFYYGTTSSCRTKVVVDDNGGSGTSIDTPARYKYTFDDLDIGTKYYYKAYVLTTDGTYYYGGVGNFTTDDDDVNPSINPISSSAGTSFDYGTSTTFSTKASDNVELDEIEMLIDGDSVKTVTSNADAGVSKSISYTTDDLEAGTHTVTVKAWDVAGNMNQTAITVTVNEEEDTTNPSINPIASSAGTSFDHKTSTTFSTKASDDVELDKIQMLIDGTSVKTVNTNADAGVSQSISYTTDDLDVGTHTVTVKAWDVAGNMNQTAITVTVNKVYHIEVTTVDTTGDETTTSIVMEGKLSLEGSYEVATVGFEYKKVNGTATTVDMNRDYTDGESFSDELTDLEPNTSYQYRAFGQIYGYGKEYGNWVTITTKDEADYLPEVITYDAENIDTNSVTLRGKLISTGEAAVSTEYGFVFNYSSNNSTTFKAGTSTSAKTFEYELTGIDDDHTYTYTSYAKNEYGTVYGEEVSFTTKELERVQLAAPQMANTSITTSAGEPVTISWTAVPNATEYNVYIWDGLGNEVSRSIEQSALTYSYTFESAGTYYVQVYALNSASEVYTDSGPGEATITVNTTVVGEILLGDVNSDGVVTNKDRFILNRYLAGMAGYTLDMINFKAADIDKDLALTDQDCTILIRHLANWTGYENLNRLSSVITGNPGTGSETCPPHTAVGGQTVYSHHVYDELPDNNLEHQVSSIVWDCVCGVCGESFAYEETEGYEGYPLPQKEKHTYDQHGICTVCMHRCAHNYVATDSVVKNTGKWENRGDGTHVRTSVMYVFKCSDCGAETRKYVNEPETPLPHTTRYDDHTLSVIQLDTSNINYYLKHQVKVDRWSYCSARNQGCDYNIHVGEVSLLQNHNFVDGLCACGFSEDQTPLMAKDTTGETFYIKWDHDSVKEFVTEENIKIYTSGSGKYFGIAFYDKNGNGVSGSSSSGKFQFTLISNSSEYVDGNRVYKDFSHKQLNSGKNYIAMQQDNYTFHCNESGRFAIKVTVDGKGCGAIPVEVVKTDSNLISGSSLYEEGDYGYSKVVAAPANILSLSNGAEKRLWFDLNTPLGELKLIENMPTYEFEFIDEEKNTLQGFWQLVYLSGVRNRVNTLVDLPANIMKLTAPNGAVLIDQMKENDDNRQMARRVATFLEEVDYNSLTERVPDMSVATLESLSYSSFGLTQLADFLMKLDYDDEIFEGDVYKNVRGLLLYYKNNGFKNFDTMVDIGKSDVISCTLSVLFAELEAVSKQLKANIVLKEIENGILDLDGVSEDMKNAIIEVLKDDSNVFDETVANATDALNGVRASIALGLCPPAEAIHWTLSVGSSLLGYESFEDALKDLLEQNEKYDQAKAKLQTALVAYKNGNGTYSQVSVAMNEYKLITADCIYLYEALRTAEASSPIKLLCTEEQSYIDAAESTTRYSNEKLLKYIEYLKTGALKP